MFAIIVAFVIPEVFSIGMAEERQFVLSIGISIVMILLYVAALYFKLVSHRGVYVAKQEIAEGKQRRKKKHQSGRGSLPRRFYSLATIAVAYISERLVHTFDTVGEQFGWSELFIGVIIVAIVGNAAEHASAVIMAYKNKMDVAVEIAFGSTLQVAMMVAPILVISSLFLKSKCH